LLGEVGEDILHIELGDVGERKEETEVGDVGESGSGPSPMFIVSVFFISANQGSNL